MALACAEPAALLRTAASCQGRAATASTSMPAAAQRVAARRAFSGGALLGVRVAACAAAATRPARGRAAPAPPRANELNRWASPDGGEGDEEGDDFTDAYDRDTMMLFTRTLTARATQKLLIELTDTDEIAALWFNNFIADAQNKPHTGDAFIQEMLATRTVLLTEPGCPPGPLAPPLRELSPAELARRVLAQRKAMAERAAGRFACYVEGANMTVLREHLTRSTYVSGK